MSANETKTKALSQVFKKGEFGGDDSIKNNNDGSGNNDLFEDNSMTKLD